MEKCFDCYAENGLNAVGVKAIADACDCNVASLYQYFDNLDDLIVKSTEYCMSKVEDDFMAKSPNNISDLWRFIDEISYWTAKKHGKKYRLMYQVYTHPKYIEYGKKFFAGVDKRYSEYAKRECRFVPVFKEKSVVLCRILKKELRLVLFHIDDVLR